VVPIDGGKITRRYSERLLPVKGRLFEDNEAHQGIKGAEHSNRWRQSFRFLGCMASDEWAS
jgi:hypothetical protein